MTEEVKKCDCKEKAIKKLKEFSFIAGAVFLGALLAILLAANILKPKCPPPGPNDMMGPRPRFERQLPPPPAMEGRMGPGQEFGEPENMPPRFEHHRHQGDNSFGGRRYLKYQKQNPQGQQDNNVPQPPRDVK